MTRTHEGKLYIQSGVSGISAALHWSFVSNTFLSIFYCMECVSVAVFFFLERKEFLPSFIHVRVKLEIPIVQLFGALAKDILKAFFIFVSIMYLALNFNGIWAFDHIKWTYDRVIFGSGMGNMNTHFQSQMPCQGVDVEASILPTYYAVLENLNSYTLAA